jgi:hypothetical protein
VLAWICHPTYHPKPARTVLCWHNIASAAAARGQPAAGPGLSQRGRRGGGAARPTCTRARSRPMERHAPTRRHLGRARLFRCPRRVGTRHSARHVAGSLGAGAASVACTATTLSHKTTTGAVYEQTNLSSPKRVMEWNGMKDNGFECSCLGLH